MRRKKYVLFVMGLDGIMASNASLARLTQKDGNQRNVNVRRNKTEYPSRVWEQTGNYIDSVTGNPCDPDDILAIPLWTSREPTRDDTQRRRETELQATQRREQAEAVRKEALKVIPLEPLRRQG